MKLIELMICFFLQIFLLIFGKECIFYQGNTTSITCSDRNLIFYLLNISNITELSLINLFLTEMPDLYDSQQIVTLHLEQNQIPLINRNYSTVENLYLTSNHIYALHLTNLSYPKLKYLDLSFNPIEHITQNFFSNEQFPRLEILKLTGSLKHINPYLIDNRLISFSALKYLNDISFDENDFEEFSCSKNITHIQWELAPGIKKISLAKNKLISLDEICFSQSLNLIELDLHSNELNDLPNFNLIMAYLSNIRLDQNLLTVVPSNFLHISKQLTELNISANQLNFQDMKSKKAYVFPGTLKILYLNSLTTVLSCSLFDNLIELEQLHLENLASTRLESCTFKKLTKLKLLNLRNHRLKTLDEQVFRPLLAMNQLHTLDITSPSLHCDSCSLRWFIAFLKSQNITKVICLDRQGKELLLNTLNLFPCSSYHLFSTMVITISISISLLLSIIFGIYIYQHRKFPFSKCSSVYHMIPLQHYNRIHQDATDDLTNDNVMLVT